MKKSFLTAIVLILSLSSQSFAHDAKFHKGPTTEGKIVSVTAKGAEIQTDKEKLAVVFTANTKFELGMDGEEGSKSDLKKGQHVMVAGHKLENDEISATEVMIHSDYRYDDHYSDHNHNRHDAENEGERSHRSRWSNR